MPDLTPAELLAKAKRRRRAPRDPKPVRWALAWPGNRLRAAREAHRLALADVAKELGLSTSRLWEFERGYDPRLSVARKLAAFYGMTVGELWP